jgi:hypothetical protein
MRLGFDWLRQIFVGDCGHGLYAAFDHEADVEMVLVAGHGELERVSEVERLAEVEASAQGTPRIGAGVEEHVLDRLPVDGVVHVPVKVDVGCA